MNLESIPEISTTLVNQYRQADKEFPFNMKMLKKESIIGVCVNAYNNQNLLETIPYRMLTDDYCIIYKFVVDEVNDGALATIVISDERKKNGNVDLSAFPLFVCLRCGHIEFFDQQKSKNI